MTLIAAQIHLLPATYFTRFSSSSTILSAEDIQKYDSQTQNQFSSSSAPYCRKKVFLWISSTDCGRWRAETVSNCVRPISSFSGQVNVFHYLFEKKSFAHHSLKKTIMDNHLETKSLKSSLRIDVWLPSRIHLDKIEEPVNKKKERKKREILSIISPRYERPVLGRPSPAVPTRRWQSEAL